MCFFLLDVQRRRACYRPSIQADHEQDISLKEDDGNDNVD